MIQRSLRLGFLGIAACVAAYGLLRALANRVPLRAVLGDLLWVEVVGLAAAVTLCALALRREVRTPPLARARERTLFSMGSLAVVLVAAWILFLAFVQPFQRMWFDLAAAAAAGAWAGILLLEGRLAALPTRWMRIAAPVFVSLAATVVLLEISLRVVAAIRPSPLLVHVGDAPRRVLERFRCKPGQLRFGFPFNRGGHYDEEFARKDEGERLVASIGDSFSVSAVPHAWHFTTVCERELGVPVANLGAPGIGPPEYLRLLVDEAMPLDPDVVLVCVFVGNDLAFAEVEKGLPDAFLRSFLQRDGVLAWVLARRWSRIAAERERKGASATRPAPKLDGNAFPWITDPSLEEPSMSEESYLRLETQRAREVCGIAPPSLDGFRDAISSMKEAAGSSRLAVMLIPDEFQVEDDLWEAIAARAGAPLDRERPQRLVAPWLEKNGIPCLDLLPALRAVPPTEDGRRHVYHLRDSHWNARGNRVAGEALARFLREILP